MQKIVIIINDAPYGTEKAYNALRLAMTLQKEHGEEVEIRIFLLADTVTCGLPNQKTPNGYYNIDLIKKSGKENISLTGYHKNIIQLITADLMLPVLCPLRCR